MKNTNISDFVDKGTYKALIDEKSCEKADGSDLLLRQAQQRPHLQILVQQQQLQAQ